MAALGPITLRGTHIRLEPMRPVHAAALLEAGRAPETWGGVVNPEAKYLLMRHAFEDWRAIRVALKTDVKNVHSQAAIKKLGARFEGTLRNQRIRPDGSYRDTVMFSIIESEWPAVKARLEQRLATLARAAGQHP